MKFKQNIGKRLNEEKETEIWLWLEKDENEYIEIHATTENNSEQIIGFFDGNMRYINIGNSIIKYEDDCEERNSPTERF